MEIVMKYTSLMVFYVLVFLFLYGTSLFMIDSIFGVTCLNKYNDSQHSYTGGCKVMYEGEYITEELYKKAFEQKLIIR